MDNNKEKKFISVYITNNQSKLALIKSLLDSNKVIYYVDNENAATIGDSLPYMNVMVFEEDAAIAKELIGE